MTDSRKRIALLAAILGSFVAILDSTVVNVALPAIERDLGGGLAAQQWISNIYLLVLGSLILVGGSLGDRYGERRIFTLGVAGFGAASALCAAAPSVETLIAARALQGMFSALLTPAALAVIIAVFPASERGVAIGSWTAWTGIAVVVGPLVGGQIVDVASWRWVFAINVPFVIATIALVRISVPGANREAATEPLDLIGAALCVLGLAGPVFALIRQPAVGWASPEVLVGLIGGGLLFAAFIAREARIAHPMLPLGLFRRRNFAIGNIQTFAIYGALGGQFFFLGLFLQQVAGYDALQAGLATLPVTIVMFSLSRRAGRLADRIGPRLLMGGGPLLAAAGVALMLRVDADFDYVTDLLPAVLIFSLGLSATVAPLTATVLADADEHNAGIASAINNAIARVAALVVIAGLGAVIAGAFAADIDSRLRDRPLSSASTRTVVAAKERTMTRVDASGLPTAERTTVAEAARDASVTAFHRGSLLCALLLGVGGALGLAGIRNPAREIAAEHCPGGQLAGAPRRAAA